ncbi:MAG: Hsp20/alpha crystallin family protein [Desulforhopalus sp.]
MNETKDIAITKESLHGHSQKLQTVSPLVDIYENNDEIVLYADMPGVKKDHVMVHVDNGKLEISGTRNLQTKGVGSWKEFTAVEYKRVFSVPQTIDAANVTAELKEGVLRLHLPKSQGARPRVIKISAS